MKRKVIELGNQCKVISLPKRWVDEHKVRKGDEIEIEEESTGDLLIKSKTEQSKILHSHTVSVDGLTTYEINRLIRGLYRSKTDQIVLEFTSSSLKDIKGKTETTIQDFCQLMCTKLIGLEMIQKTTKSITFQCFVSREDEESLQVTERRIFFLIKEFMQDILGNIDQFTAFHAIVYERHDQIAKFCEYYLRGIVHVHLPVSVRLASYSLISLLDKLADLLRYLCDEIKYQKTTPKVKSILSDIFALFSEYQTFLFSTSADASSLIKQRYALLHQLQQEKFTLKEFKIIAHVLFILHLMNDFLEVKRIRELGS